MRIEWFTKKTQGAVSIMLCILMFPMILFSSLVIDTSRIYAAKTAISGAGDLAMNALLSEYEKSLYEMYGLFATCTNEAELKTAVNDYFKRTIERSIGSGASESAIEEFADSLTEFAFDENASFDNLVSLTVASEGGFSIDGVPSSALANPAVLRRQINEMMKYRGPISIASSLLNKIGIFKSSSKQTEVLEKKVNYCSEMDGLTDLCLDTYKEIVGYTDDKGKKITGYNESADGLNKQRDSVKLEKVFVEIVPRWYYLAALALLVRDSVSQATQIMPDSFYAGSVSNYGNVVDFNSNEGKNYQYSFSGESEKYTGNDLPANVSKYFKDWNENTVKNLSSEVKETAIKCLKDYGTSKGQITNLEKLLSEIIDEENKDDPVFRNIVGEISITGGSGSYSCSIKNDPNTPYEVNGIIRIGLKDIKEYYQSYEDLSTFNGMMSDKIYLLDDQIMQKKYKQITGFNRIQRKLLLLSNGNSSNLKPAFIWLTSEAIPKYKQGIETHNKLVQVYQWLLKSKLEEEGEDTDLATLKQADPYFAHVYEQNLRYQEINKSILQSESFLDATTGKSGTFFASAIADTKIYDKCSENYIDAALYAGLLYLVPATNAFARAQKAEQKVDEILKKLDEIEAKKKEWETSIKESDDGAIKASMESDYKATTEAYNKDEIKAFYLYMLKKESAAAEIVGSCNETTFYYPGGEKKVFDKNLTVEDLEAALNVEKSNVGNLSLEYIAGQTIYKNYKCSDKLSGESNQQWIQPPSEESKLPAWKPIQYTGKKEVFSRSGIVDGYDDESKTKEKCDEEKFWFLLERIGKAAEAKYEKTDEQEKQESDLNDVVTENDKRIEESEGKDKDSNNDNNEGNTETDISIGDISSRVSSYISSKGTSEDDDSEEPDEDDPVGKDVNSSSNSTKGMKVPSGGQNKSSYKSEGSKASGGLSGGKSFLERLKNLGLTVRTYAYEEEFFTELFSCHFDTIEERKTPNLLNQRYKEDTAWFGKEIEYILWGDSNLSSNMAKTDATIYVIRLAVNAIYAFTAADIQSFANSLALAIAGWTVFGVPIVQAVITLGLALAESAIDLQLLKQGKDVVIMKSQTTFVCSPSGFLSTAAEMLTDATQKALEKAGNAVKKKARDVFDDVTKTIGDELEKATNYVNEQIDDTMDGVCDLVVSTIANPLITAVGQVCLRFDTNLGDCKEELDQAFDEAVQGIREDIQNMPDSITKDIATKAIDCFESQIAAELKQKLFDVIKKYDNSDGNRVNLSLEINNLINEKVKSVKDKISGAIKEKTDSLKNTALQELEKRKDQTLDTFDGFVDETLGDVSDKISGTITSSVEYWSGTADAMETTKDSTAGAKGMTLNYKEYCKIFVLIALAAGKEENMLKRAAVLIEANVRAKEENSDFSITKAYTVFVAKGSVKMKTLLPWGTEILVQDGEENDFWEKIKPYFGNTEATMMYRAINGY